MSPKALPSLTENEQHLARVLWGIQWTSAEALQRETSLAVDDLLRALEGKGIVTSFHGRRSIHANGEGANVVMMYQLTTMGNRLFNTDPPALSPHRQATIEGAWGG